MKKYTIQCRPDWSCEWDVIATDYAAADEQSVLSNVMSECIRVMASMDCEPAEIGYNDITVRYINTDVSFKVFFRALEVTR